MTASLAHTERTWEQVLDALESYLAGVQVHLEAQSGDRELAAPTLPGEMSPMTAADHARASELLRRQAQVQAQLVRELTRVAKETDYLIQATPDARHSALFFDRRA